MRMTIPQFLALIALVVGLILLGIFVFPNVDWDELIDRFRFNVSDRTAVEEEYEKDMQKEEPKDNWL